MKKISESKRILVGWGRHGDRACYFISHKALKSSPMPCYPEDLQTIMKKLIDKIDGGKPKRSKS